MQFLILFLYNVLVTLAWPLVWVVAIFNSKLRGNLAGQREIKQSLDRFRKKTSEEPRPIVWLHAASAGEFEQLQPVLDALQQEKVWIFQTFTSSTIYLKSFTDKRFHGVSYLPWDLVWRTRRFIKTLDPNLFVNTRHDLWPNLLNSLKRAGVRSVLINANLYPDSARLWPVLKSINAVIFNQISQIYTVSENVAGLIRRLYAGELVVSGDTRFDRVAQRAQRVSGSLLSEGLIDQRPVVVLGSVLDSDLAIIVPAMAEHLKQHQVLFVLVPHETRERDITPWEVALFRHSIKAVRYSELEHYKGENVIIWNTVGQLADLYQHASLAYVGAGFGAGVHSVTEPAIYHVPAAHGPSYQILAEAVELVELQISRVITTPDELSNWLQLLDHPDELQRLRDALQRYMEERLGATHRILKMELARLISSKG